jgi:hypothetical protein
MNALDDSVVIYESVCKEILAVLGVDTSKPISARAMFDALAKLHQLKERTDRPYTCIKWPEPLQPVQPYQPFSQPYPYGPFWHCNPVPSDNAGTISTSNSPGC